MKGKVVVITGGSRGIEFETAKALFRQGAIVIIGYRNLVLAKNSKYLLNKIYDNSSFSFIHLDLNDYGDVKKFSEKIILKYGKIDILINNAGSCFLNFTLHDGIELTYFTNHIGHLIISSLLLEYFNSRRKNNKFSNN